MYMHKSINLKKKTYCYYSLYLPDFLDDINPGTQMAGIGLDGILTLWSRQPDTLCKPFICIFMSDRHKRVISDTRDKDVT